MELTSVEDHVEEWSTGTVRTAFRCCRIRRHGNKSVTNNQGPTDTDNFGVYGTLDETGFLLS